MFLKCHLGLILGVDYLALLAKSVSCQLAKVSQKPPIAQTGVLWTVTFYYSTTPLNKTLFGRNSRPPTLLNINKTTLQ